MHGKEIITSGLPIEKAKKVLILLHGRGGSAQNIIQLTNDLKLNNFAILVPQASRNTWYPYSFMMPQAMNEPWLGHALKMLAEMESSVLGQGYNSDDIYFAGFSQGACLSLEYTARNAKQYGGVIAFTGGLIGDKINETLYSGDFKNTPVFIGTSDPDPHVPVDRVYETDHVFKKLKADTHIHIYREMGHTIIQDELDRVNQIFFSGK